MNNLATNIEYLLLSRNCVIVPSLGAFCATDTPARWISDEDVFLPPVRHINFDASIQSDPEDFFVRSLAEIYNWTTDVARKRCQKTVEDFHKTLISEGTVDFGSIGVFTLEDDAEITMASCECGVITPDYYGLDTLHFTHISEEDRVSITQKTIMEIIPEQIVSDNTHNVSTAQVSTKSNAAAASNNNSDDDHYTIRISKSAVNYAMAIAATIALFFIMRPTTVSNNVEYQQMARPVMFLQPEMIKQDNSTAVLETLDADNQLDQESDELLDGALIDVTDELMEEESLDNTQEVVAETPKAEPAPAVEKTPAKVEVKTPVKVEAKAPARVEVKAPVAKAEPKAPAVAASANSSSYCIVLASGVSKANAEVFIGKLAKDNIKATLLEGELRRVVIDGFATYEAAHQHMATLKATGNCMDAWVLKK